MKNCYSLFSGRLWLLLAGLLIVSAPSFSASAGDAAIEKVVYHIDYDDPERVSATLASINNMILTYQETLTDYDVRIVFLGSGIRYTTSDPLKGTPFEANKAFKERGTELLNRINGLREFQEVKLELCEITRQAVGLSKKKLLPGITLVKSGVVRLAELQKQGFAYIKIQ